MHPEEGQLALIAALEGDTSRADREEAAAAQAEGIAPFARHDLAGLWMASTRQTISAAANSRLNIARMSSRPSTGSCVA
ncbi:hypothetical protein [Sabulicella rubraurantiaca]|uniref:hypothetical protein n=1 Tax=Sabulicella rubraurantiaca TaxID=2811429 RepID=UPI001F298723|nr:hypothetical protein [Sabulicella rubraurantiaca]